MNILIIEDDRFLAKKIWDVFASRVIANRIKTLHSYEAFLNELAVVGSYDIVLVDLKLSDDAGELSGYRIIRAIRERGDRMPIVVISGFWEIDRLQLAFEYGASDYIIKPFRLRELEVRILNWFRNYCLWGDGMIKEARYRDLRYDLECNEFYSGDRPIALTRQAKYLLGLFLTHPDKLLSDSFLSEKLWGDRCELESRNLRIGILRLKNALAPYGMSAWIRNVRGEGYVFSAKC